MLDEFLAFFRSLTRSMDIVYVIDGAKPVSRISVDEVDLDATKKFLDNQGLKYAVSDFKVKQFFDKSGFSNKGTILPAGSKEKGAYFVYVSKEKELAEKAGQFGKEGNDIELGKLLGYPKCCCEFFKKNAAVESKRQNDYVLATLRESDGFVFPFYTNVAIRQIDINLLSHFPCSFKCEESIKIAKKHLEILRKWSSELGDIAEGMLKGAVIYTNTQGMFLLRQPELNKNEISYEGVMSPIKGNIYDALKHSDKVIVVDKNHIKLSGLELKGPDFGVLFFN
jgi:hypothetical protein